MCGGVYILKGATFGSAFARLEFPRHEATIWVGGNLNTLQPRPVCRSLGNCTHFALAVYVGAVLIFLGVAAAAGLAMKRLGKMDLLTKFAFLWLGLILVQIALGIETIWSNKAADIATAHVLVGALSLVVGVLWCVIAFARQAPLPETQPGALYHPEPVLAGAK